MQTQHSRLAASVGLVPGSTRHCSGRAGRRGGDQVRSGRQRQVHLLLRASAGAAHQARRHRSSRARGTHPTTCSLDERQDALSEARSDQGQPADRAVLHRGRRAWRHAGRSHRQDRLQPGLGLGRIDSLLRRAGAGVQDHDDHGAGAGPPVRLAHRPEPARRHPRSAEQQDRQDRSPAAALLRHHRHRAGGQGMHQLAGSRARTARTWTSTKWSKASPCTSR